MKRFLLLFWCISQTLYAQKPSVLTSPVEQTLNQLISPKSVQHPIQTFIDEKLKTAKKVKVGLFVMSQCPYGVDAEKAILPILKKYGSQVELHLNFIGFPVINGELKSLHGKPEADEDMRQVIIAQLFPEKLNDYVFARAENYQTENWKGIAQKLGINTNEVERLMQNGEGKKLLTDNFQIADKLQVFSSPTILIDNVKYEGGIVPNTKNGVGFQNEVQASSFCIYASTCNNGDPCTTKQCINNICFFTQFSCYSNACVSASCSNSQCNKTYLSFGTPTNVSADQTAVNYGSNVTLTASCPNTGSYGVVWFSNSTVGTAVGLGSPFVTPVTTNTQFYAGCGGGPATGAGGYDSSCHVLVRVATSLIQINTSTALTADINPSSTGQNVTFTATVSPNTATGTVTFIDGTTTLGTGTLSGGLATFATTALTAGTHSITAAYGGDVNYVASTSTAVSQIVNCVVLADPTNISLTTQGNTMSVSAKNTTNNLSNSKIQVIPSANELNQLPNFPEISTKPSTKQMVENEKLDFGYEFSEKLEQIYSAPTNYFIENNYNSVTPKNKSLPFQNSVMQACANNRTTTCDNGDPCTVKQCIRGTCIFTPVNSPTGASVSSQSIFDGQNITLSATCSSGIVTWINSGDLSVQGTGSPLTLSPTATITYGVYCNIVTDPTTQTQLSIGSCSTTLPQVTVLPAVSICSGESISLAASCTSGTITWYNASTGGTAIGTGSPFTQNPTATTTYYADCEIGSCASNRVLAGQASVILVVSDPTNISNPTICNNVTASLSASCETGNVVWYNSSGSASVGIGTFLTPNLTANISYKVRCESGNCTSNFATANVLVNSVISDPTNISNPTICNNVTASLSASCVTGNVIWYNSSGSASVGIGTFLTPTLTANISYKVRCESGSCTSNFATANVLVNSVISDPTNISNPTICNNVTASLSASCETGNVVWYNSSGSASVGIGTFLTPTLTANISYKVRCESGNCTSNFATANVLVNSVISDPTNISNPTICNNVTASLSASCETGNVVWYNSSGSASVGIGTFLTPTLTANISYKVRCESGNCTSNFATANVLVNSAISDPTNISNPTICNNVTASLSASCEVGTVVWYNSSGSASVGIGTFLTPTLTANISYKVRCESGSCTSNFATANVLVNSAISDPTNISNPTICNNVTASLSASCETGNVVWYNSSGSASVGIGTFLTPTLTANISYKVRCESGSCTSNFATANVLVNSVISDPTNISNPTICNNVTASLSASCETGNVVWYNSSGSASVGIGTFLTPNLTANISYKVRCESGNCTSNFATANVLVNSVISDPTNISNPTICNNVTASLSASCETGNVVWYNSSGSASVGIGTFLTPNLTANISYKVRCESGNCTSNFATANVLVNSVISDPTNISNPTICNNVTASLSASCVTGNVIWYNSSGSASVGIGTFLTPTLTANISYKVRCESGSCTSNFATANVLVNSVISDPTNISNPTICNNVTASLSASCETGNVVWYNSSGSASVGIGTFLTPTLTANISYKVRCESGNCTSNFATANVLVNSVISDPTNISNPTICNNVTASLSASCETGNVVWYNSSGSASVGIGTFLTPTLTANISYKVRCESGNCTSNFATANVLVNSAISDPTNISNPTICNNVTASLSASCEVGTVVWYNSSGSASVGIGTFLTPTLTANISYKVRCESGSCTSNFATANVLVNSAISDPTNISNPTICNNVTASLSASCETGNVVWYNSSGSASVGIGTFLTPTLTANISYKVRCESGNCTSNFATANVLVNSVISDPTNISNPTICNNVTASLSASCETGNVVWYNSSGSASVGIGTFLTPNLTANISYKVRCESGNCTSNFATANVLVNSVISDPTNISNPTICNNVTASLSASCETGNVVWYNSSGSASVGIGTFLTPTLTANISYKVRCESGNCTSNFATANVLVNSAISDPTNISNPTICNNVTASLSASCETGNVVWYNSSGSASVGIGTFLTPNLTANISYKVRCESGNCTSNFATANVLVNSVISDPTNISNPTICNNVTASLSASCETGNVIWYNSAGSASVGIGTFLTPTLTANISYKVRCESGNCTSNFATANVLVNSVISDPTNISNPTICNNVTASLSASCEVGTVVWYNSSGSASVGIGTFLTPNLTANISYKVRCESGNCTSNFATANVLVNSAISDPTNISNPTICNNVTASLSASCETGNVVWYNSSGSASVGIGTFLTPTLTANISYKVRCESGNCTSNFATANVLVNSVISDPTNISNPTICNNVTASLSASCVTGNVIWYNSSGSASVGIGTFLTPTLTANISYKVRCESGSCTSNFATANVLVNSVISDPTNISNPTICNNVTASLSASCETGNVVWYNSSGSASVGIGTFLTPTLTANISYKVRCESGNCTSNFATANVLVNSVISDPTNISNPTICNGLTASLSASCEVGTVVWYNSAGSASVGIGTFLTPILTANISYKVRCESGNCTSNFATANVLVNSVISDPTNISNPTICNNVTASLSASCETGNVVWYNSAGSASVGIGTFLTPTLTANISYKVRCESGNCTSNFATANVLVNSVISDPTNISNPTICNNVTASLSASCVTGNEIWYNSSGSASVGIGTFLTPTLTANISYKVRCESGNCTSNFATANVLVNSAISDPTNISNPTICNNVTASLSASCEVGTVVWYNSSGSASVGIGTFLTPTLTANISYKVRCESGNCTSNFATANVLVNSVISDPTNISNPTICNNVTASLSASCVTGNVIWYNSSGSASVGIGTFLTPTLTANISYKVRCESGNCTSNFATANVLVNSVISDPTNISNPTICNNVTASLSASCVTGNVIWYNSSGSASVGIGTFLTPTLTANISYKVRCESGSCTSNFATANVLVNSVISDPTNISNPTICNNVTASLSASCETGNVVWYNSSGSASVGIGTFLTPTLTANISYKVRCESGNCTSNFATANVLVNSAISDPTNISNPTICNNVTASLSASCETGNVVWYNSSGSASVGIGTFLTPTLTANISYKVRCESGNCTSNFATANVSVNSVISDPTNISNPTICNGLTASLSASCEVGTVVWYNSSGSASVGIGTFLTPNLTANISYKVRCESGNCTSNFATANVLVNSVISDPTNISNPTICNNVTASLSASCVTGNVVWYNSAGSASVGIGTFLTPTLSANISYKVRCESGNCTSNFATANVLVNSVISDPTNISNPTICNNVTASLSASCVTGNVVWYNSAGSASVGIGTFLTPNLTANISYKVRCESGNCTSNFATANVSVNSVISDPTNISNPTICNNVTASLSASCEVGMVVWYNSAGSASVGIGTFLTPTLTANISYKVRCESGNCTSNFATANVLVNSVISDPTNISNPTICNNVTASLSASCETGNVVWYNSSGSASVGIGTFLTPTLTANISYKVRCESGSCTSNFATANVLVNSVISDPTNISDTQVLFGTGTTLTATCSGGNIVTWYASNTATTPLGTGNLPTGNLTATTDYYVDCETGGSPNCVSARSKLTVTVLSPPTPVAAGATICSGDAVTLTATGCTGSVGTFVLKWYKTSDNSLATMPVSPTTDTQYYAKCEQTFNAVTAVSAKSNDVSVLIFNNIVPAVADASICLGGSTTLTASGCSGVGFTINWYQVADNQPVTMPVSPTETTQYYAKCFLNACTSQQSNVATVFTPIFTVINTNDAGFGSLRNAMTAQNASSCTGTFFIKFDASLTGQTITLLSALPQINKNLTFVSPSTDCIGRITIARSSSAAQFSVFSTAPSLPNLNVTFNDLIISGGDSPDNGGGINFNNAGKLTLNRMVIANNNANASAGKGGGVYSGGDVVLNNSLIQNNSANASSGLGGGLNISGNLTATSSTFFNNSAQIGGGIYAQSGVKLTNITLSGNTATEGSALKETTAGAVVQLINSTIANNTTSNAAKGAIDLVSTSNTFTNCLIINNLTGKNIVGSGTSAGGNFSSDASATAIFTQLSDKNNVVLTLSPLAMNGGCVPTHGLLCGSAAIDAGVSTADVPATDARGIVRTSPPDVGAYEAEAGTFQITDPVSVTTCAGSSVTFSVVTSGQVASYLWQKDNANINGATSSSLTLSNVSATDAGGYRVLVSGCSGAPIASNPATLTIQNTLPPTSISGNLTIVSGGNTNLTANGCAGTVKWYDSATGSNLLFTGNPFNAAPTATTSYFASCTTNTSCESPTRTSVTVSVGSTPCGDNPTLSNYSSGTTLVKATNTITAANQISGTANVTYQAGKSVTLQPGFKADNGTIFKAQIAPCN